MAWASEGILTNPALDAILADSGALPACTTGVTVLLGGSVACICTLEHRNAANTANIASQVIAITANQLLPMDLPGVVFAANERIRIRLNVGVTGSLQASLLTYQP